MSLKIPNFKGIFLISDFLSALNLAQVLKFGGEENNRPLSEGSKDWGLRQFFWVKNYRGRGN